MSRIAFIVFFFIIATASHAQETRRDGAVGTVLQDPDRPELADPADGEETSYYYELACSQGLGMIATDGPQITTSWYHWQDENQMMTYGTREGAPGIYVVVADEAKFFPLDRFTRTEYTEPGTGRVISFYRAAVTDASLKLENEIIELAALGRSLPPRLTNIRLVDPWMVEREEEERQEAIDRANGNLPAEEDDPVSGGGRPPSSDPYPSATNPEPVPAQEGDMLAADERPIPPPPVDFEVGGVRVNPLSQLAENGRAPVPLRQPTVTEDGRYVLEGLTPPRRAEIPREPWDCEESEWASCVSGDTANDHHTQNAIMASLGLALTSLPDYFRRNFPAWQSYIADPAILTPTYPQDATTRASWSERRLTDYRANLRTALCNCEQLPALREQIQEVKQHALFSPIANFLSCEIM
ncbi:MAG: hypothetical protein HRT45_16405 [Bdellovibrionales bacterium]|nr:hypothetical protein [Bdellovibrionales bacterium]